MNTTNTTNIIEAKRQLVTDLKAMLDSKFQSGDRIEAKAVNLFKFSSATLGIVAGLKITIPGIQDNPLLTVCFAILIIDYIAHVYFMYKVIKPTSYSIVPGIPRLTSSYSYAEFRQDYIEGGEDGYLEHIISDLAGIDDESGAIEDAEMVNRKKAKQFDRLSMTFVIMVGVLLAMGFGIAFNS